MKKSRILLGMTVAIMQLSACAIDPAKVEVVNADVNNDLIVTQRVGDGDSFAGLVDALKTLSPKVETIYQDSNSGPRLKVDVVLNGVPIKESDDVKRANLTILSQSQIVALGGVVLDGDDGPEVRFPQNCIDESKIEEGHHARTFSVSVTDGADFDEIVAKAARLSIDTSPNPLFLIDSPIDLRCIETVSDSEALGSVSV